MPKDPRVRISIFCPRVINVEMFGNLRVFYGVRGEMVKKFN